MPPYGSSGGGPAERSLRRPVATVMAFVAIAMLGIVSFSRLPIDLLPDVSFPTLTVWTAYPDAGPAEVERFITGRVEEELSRVPGVREVTSRSREGQSLVRLGFHWGTDMEFATLHARERLENLREALPESAERPLILRADPTSEPIMTLAVTGTDLLELRELAEAVFKRRLEQLDGVALATVTGGPVREIRVVVDRDALRAHRIGMRRIAEALDAANYSAAGGRVRRGRFEYSLRTLGQFDEVADFGNVRLAGADGQGGGVRLRDVATVRDTFAERETAARFNGQPAIGIQVYKESGTNTVRVAGEVGEVLDRVRAEFPEARVEVAASQAEFISDAIANVVQALLVGGVLAFLVLFLFLRDPRYPVAIGLAIPISVLAAFALCYLFDVSLNVMSLGGLALGVGMLVDNSIVVLENIFRHREEGRGSRASAGRGTREVTGAITASTLTTIAVFGPVLYVEGVAGALFGDLSLAVAFALLASLLVAVTLLPVLAARLASGASRASRAGSGALAAFDRGFERFASRYERALAWSLAHRPGVLGVAVLSLAVAVAIGSTLPRGLMPRVDEGTFRVELELPVGTALEVTSETAARLEAMLLETEGVETVFARVGRTRGAVLAARQITGLNTASLEVRLGSDAPPTDRVMADVRDRMAGSGADTRHVTLETGRATSLGRALDVRRADLAVRVQGQELEPLLAVADSARARLAGMPGLADVRVDIQRTQPLLEIEILRDAAARHDLTVREVADALEAYLRGAPTERPFTRFAEKIAIRVEVPEAGRRELSDVMSLTVEGVPVRELARVRRGYGPVEIRRDGQRRSVAVLAEVREGGLSRAVERVETRLADLERPALTSLEVGGENEEMRRSFRSLGFAFALALFLVLLILAAQFESLVQPFVILAAVPLAGIGAAPALWLTGGGLNAMSGIGLVILIGIVVNDAIIKVDFINRHRREGGALREAILRAGRLRLRPIVMTTVTTALGLLPLALGWGAGADLRAPLAVVVIGGLLSSTLLTLLVVPVLYSVLVRPGEPVASPRP